MMPLSRLCGPLQAFTLRQVIRIPQGLFKSILGGLQHLVSCGILLQPDPPLS